MSLENYSLQTSGGMLDRLALKKRLRMFEVFMHQFEQQNIQSILDVGVTADLDALSSNFFEKYYPDKTKIIALSNQQAKYLECIYPGVRFQHGDALDLPYKDDEIDVVFSSAVIEHVGSIIHQEKMIAEAVRVARKGVFITTPNRWYPIELHTLLPIIHWLPKKNHRFILSKLGFDFFSKENNLNLLGANDLARICNRLGISNYQILKVRTFGFVSNLILVVKNKS